MRAAPSFHFRHSGLDPTKFAQAPCRCLRCTHNPQIPSTGAAQPFLRLPHLPFLRPRRHETTNATERTSSAVRYSLQLVIYLSSHSQFRTLNHQSGTAGVTHFYARTSQPYSPKVFQVRRKLRLLPPRRSPWLQYVHPTSPEEIENTIKQA